MRTFLWDITWRLAAGGGLLVGGFVPHSGNIWKKRGGRMKPTNQRCWFKTSKMADGPSGALPANQECENKTHSLQAAPRTVALADRVWTSRRCHIVLEIKKSKSVSAAVNTLISPVLDFNLSKGHDGEKKISTEEIINFWSRFSQCCVVFVKVWPVNIRFLASIL